MGYGLVLRDLQVVVEKSKHSDIVFKFFDSGLHLHSKIKGVGLEGCKQEFRPTESYDSMSSKLFNNRLI